MCVCLSIAMRMKCKKYQKQFPVRVIQWGHRSNDRLPRWAVEGVGPARGNFYVTKHVDQGVTLSKVKNAAVELALAYRGESLRD